MAKVGLGQREHIDMKTTTDGDLPETHNGSGIAEGGVLKDESFNPPLNLNRITNDEFST